MANDVEIKIGADTTSANKSIDSFKKSAVDNASIIQNSFDKIKTAAAAAVAVFAAKNVFDFFKGGITAAAESELAFIKMQKALELSGNAAPGVAEAFDQLAANIERITGISDEAVQEQIALAQTFGLTNAETQKLIIAATDLSAATGESLSTSVKALGNTLNGTLGTLKKTVPELRSLDEAALKSGKAIDFVLSRFDGSAAKNLESFTGAAEQVGIAFGKIPEAFGKAVIENENLRKALETITEVFYGLSDIVTQSQGNISKLVSLGLTPLMGILGTGVGIIGFFNTALNGIQLTAVGLVRIFADINAAIKDAYASFLEFKGGEGFEKARIAADAAKVSAEEYKKVLQDMVDVAIKEKKAFDDLSKKIFEFKTTINSTTKSIEQLTIAENKAKKARALAAKDLDALGKSYDALYKGIISSAEDARTKEILVYKENLKEFERLRKSEVFSLGKLNKLKVELELTHQANLLAIEKKGQDERQKQISDIMSNTNLFQKIKIAFDPDSGEDLAESIREFLKAEAFTIGAGAISAISNGAAGADAVTGFVTTLISKIPLFGGLVAELVKLAAMAPEKNKEAIQGFAKGIPEFLSNINTNLGSLTDILNEVIGPVIEKVITSSGLGNLFTNLMKNIIKLPELIATIIEGVAGGIRKSAGEFALAIKKAFADTGAEFTRFVDSVKNFFGTFSEQVRTAFAFVFKSNPLLNELISLKELMVRAVALVQFFSTLFSSIVPAILSIRDLLNGISEKFTSAFENLGAKFTDGFLQVRDQISSLFSGIKDALDSLPNKIKEAFGNLAQGFKNAIVEAFSNFFQTFENLGNTIKGFLEKFSGGGLGSVSGGGKGKDPLTTALGLARGITEVPSGFPNDTFPARLTSGERVVDTNTNSDLKDFLASAGGAGFGGQEAIALLRQIASKLGSSGGSQTIEVMIDKKVLGRTILDLNRRNERINA